MDDGSFVHVRVRDIHRYRCPARCVRAGQMGSFALDVDRGHAPITMTLDTGAVVATEGAVADSAAAAASAESVPQPTTLQLRRGQVLVARTAVPSVCQRFTAKVMLLTSVGNLNVDRQVGFVGDDVWCWRCETDLSPSSRA